MYQFNRLAAAAVVATMIGGTALASDPVKVADERVAQTRSLVVQARASGDAASIADAHAKYQAAQAQAWGVRHPAPPPSPNATSIPSPRH